MSASFADCKGRWRILHGDMMTTESGHFGRQASVSMIDSSIGSLEIQILTGIIAAFSARRFGIFLEAWLTRTAGLLEDLRPSAEVVARPFLLMRFRSLFRA